MEFHESSLLVQDTVFSNLEASIDKFYNQNLIEKTFLHTDRDTYSINENIFYSIYAVLGEKHHFSRESSVVHVDLSGPGNEIIIAQTHEIVGGRGHGAIKIPKKLPAGTYLLRSYTNWMRNFGTDFFFRKVITIHDGSTSSITASDENENIDLQFFPEGGQLVASLPTNVAFKAIGTDGLGKEISGRILDSQGNLVGQMKSITRGMGTFPLQPKSNERYIAVLEDGSEFDLPKVRHSGYVLTVDNLNSDYLIVHVKAQEKSADSPFYLLGTLRNKKELHVKFDFGDKKETKFKVAKKEIPNGVLVLTLFDENLRPWCERLVFIESHKKRLLDVAIENERFEKRKRLTFDLTLKDGTKNSILADFSVAVIDLDRTSKDVGSSNILSYLLFESDIRGFIEQPSLLFQDKRKPAIYALDLIMLTHGWRKFNWPAIFEKKENKKEFGFSKGIELSGIVKTNKKRLFVDKNLAVLAKSDQEIHSYQTKTDSIGRFLIDDFNISGKSEVVFNGFDSKGKPSDILVELDTTRNILPIPDYLSYFGSNPGKHRSSDLRKGQLTKDSFIDFEKTVQLEEVTVTDSKIEKRQPASPSVYGVTPDAVIFADEYANNRITQLISRFSGVRVAGNKVSIRGGGGPLWVVDGIAITSSSGGAWNGPEPVPDMILNFDYDALERVEVLKGPSAAVFGMKAGHNGVILIYTKKGENRTPRKILSPSFDLSGHAVEREFYSPKYDVTNDSLHAIDQRSTLYWNPSLTIDDNGRTSINFFNSDSAKRMHITINGLSSNGEPITYQKTFGIDN